MKHLLKWVIPTVVLLLVGVWIGLNWKNFPANEEVFVPVVQKNKVKADTAVSPTVNLEMATATVMDTLQADQEVPTDEDVEINAAIEVPETPEEPETIIPDEIVLASSTPAVVLSNRNSNPENNRRTNKNLTPSVKKSVQPIPVVQQPILKEKSLRKGIVPESYMSKRVIPVDHLVKVDGTYKPDASGKGVGDATFIVYNLSGKNLKRVNLEVYYLGKGNQLLDKREMPVTNIAADGSVNVKLPANAEAERLVYKVLYVSSALGDFYYEPLANYASVLK